MLGAVAPEFRIDDVDREVLEEIVADSGTGEFSAEDRRGITNAGRTRRLTGLCAGAGAAATALRVCLVYDPLIVAGHRRAAPQRYRLGRGDPRRE